MVMTAGSPSGTTPTASATTSMSASTHGAPCTSVAKARSPAAMAMAKNVTRLPNRSICTSSGVFSVRTCAISAEMRPISVRAPVSIAMPVPCPLAISVPE